MFEVVSHFAQLHFQVHVSQTNIYVVLGSLHLGSRPKKTPKLSDLLGQSMKRKPRGDYVEVHTYNLLGGKKRSDSTITSIPHQF